MKGVLMTFQTNTDKVIKIYNRRLRRISKEGIPLAAAATLDKMAFESRKMSIKEFEKDYIIRTSWTQRGMLFEKTRKGIPIAQMESRSGNIRPYAVTLEKGDTLTADGEFISIPAMAARIGKNKRKRVSKKFAKGQFSVRRLPKISGTPRRRFAAMLNIARKEKYFGPFLVTDDDAGSDRIPHGYFILTGQGRGKRKGGTITMIRKLQSTVKVPGSPFILPVGAKIGRQMDRIYVRQAKRTLNKFGRDIR